MGKYESCFPSLQFRVTRGAYQTLVQCMCHFVYLNFGYREGKNITKPFSIFETSRLVHLIYLMANEFLEKTNSLHCFSLGGFDLSFFCDN